MQTCFVIQPFDSGKFDKRYVDIFEPAIKDAGLTPYRVDRDVSVVIPIESIQEQIQASAICLAEISTDNPNVWFELGFALAIGRPLVMVCAAEREIFPFDVRHRQIIRYKTESLQDFSLLKTNISDKLLALLQRSENLMGIAALSPSSQTEGLSPIEIAALVIVSQNLSTDEDYESASSIHRQMTMSGFTDLATTLAIRSLRSQGKIETVTAQDDYGHNYSAFRTTESGFQWLNANQSLLTLRRPPPRPDTFASPDDVPF